VMIVAARILTIQIWWEPLSDDLIRLQLVPPQQKFNHQQQATPRSVVHCTTNPLLNNGRTRVIRVYGKKSIVWFLTEHEPSQSNTFPMALRIVVSSKVYTLPPLFLLLKSYSPPY
jgi:hypothetical protein